MGLTTTRWPIAEPQSALVALAPEAEDLVARFRAEFDPSAAAGIPAHITLLYPFVSPRSGYRDVEGLLRAVIGAHGTIDYQLSQISRFRGVVYLQPEPDLVFRALTAALWEAFPDHPPYEGVHATVIPHLTVGATRDEAALDQLAEELAHEASGVLPVSACVRDIALMDNRQGPWQVVEKYPLGLA